MARPASSDSTGRPSGAAGEPGLVQPQLESWGCFVPGIIGMQTLITTMLVMALTVVR